MAWRVSVLTSFPSLFPGPLGHGVTGRGLKEALWTLEAVDYRDFATDKHKSIDDTPYGGGSGMILRPDILSLAYENVKDRRKPLLLSPRGRPLTQQDMHQLASEEGVILICGRYEGFDQRAIDHYQFEEVSIGDYVLSGGEIAACAVIDACVRLLPHVLGNDESLENESFEHHLLEHGHYTKPQIWQGQEVPDVLISGHHERIAKWRLEQAKALTKTRRPDLWEKYCNLDTKNK